MARYKVTVLNGASRLVMELDADSVDVKPVDVKPVEVKPVEVKPAEGRTLAEAYTDWYNQPEVPGGSGLYLEVLNAIEKGTGSPDLYRQWSAWYYGDDVPGLRETWAPLTVAESFAVRDAIRGKAAPERPTLAQRWIAWYHSFGRPHLPLHTFTQITRTLEGKQRGGKQLVDGFASWLTSSRLIPSLSSHGWTSDDLEELGRVLGGGEAR